MGENGNPGYFPSHLLLSGSVSEGLSYKGRSLQRRIRLLTCWPIYLFRLQPFNDYYTNGILSKKEANVEKEEENRKEKNQRGGALQRKRGPIMVDKVGWVLSNFVTPAPTFAKAFQALGSQAMKGIMDIAFPELRIRR